MAKVDWYNDTDEPEDYINKYYRVSWCGDKACMLFRNIDKAICQFRYEIVFESDVKLCVISKEEYEEISKRCRR